MIKTIQTVIFCGGLGTRLREETEYRPKPMVPVGGKPLLWHIMKIYANYGYTDFVLPIGYKGDMIKEYFYHYHLMNRDVTIRLGNHHAVSFLQNIEVDDWTIALIDTGEATLKGARLKRVEKYISGNEVMVTYGDGVADIDINRLLKFHRSHGKMATVTGVSTSSRFGDLQISGDTVQHFGEKIALPDHYISGGFFVFNRDIFSLLSEDEKCDLEEKVLEKLAAEGELMIYKHDGKWACMDTLRDVEYLNQLWDDNKAFWKVWR